MIKNWISFNETLKSHTIDICERRLDDFFIKREYIKKGMFDFEKSGRTYTIYNDRYTILKQIKDLKDPESCFKKLSQEKKEKSIKYYENILKDFKYGDIHIFYHKNNENTLRDLLHLINSFGYFVAVASGSKDKRYIKIHNKKLIFSKLKNMEYISLMIEPNFDVQMKKKNRYLYHTTNKKNIDKILKYGLIPKSKNTRSFYPDRIYLSPNLFINKFIKNQLEDDKKSENITLRIKKFPGLKLYRDHRYPSGYFTYTNIPPEYISVLKND